MNKKYGSIILDIVVLIVGLALGYGYATMVRPGGGAGGVIENAELRVGDTAPDFILPDSTGGKIALSDYRGKNVVLAFYPAAWTPV